MPHGDAHQQCAAASDCQDGPDLFALVADPAAGRTATPSAEGQQIEADHIPVEVRDGHALVALDLEVRRLIAIGHRPSLPDPERARCRSKVSCTGVYQEFAPGPRPCRVPWATHLPPQTGVLGYGPPDIRCLPVSSAGGARRQPLGRRDT
jgi:hypothetical protein